MKKKYEIFICNLFAKYRVTISKNSRKNYFSKTSIVFVNLILFVSFLMVVNTLGFFTYIQATIVRFFSGWLHLRVPTDTRLLNRGSKTEYMRTHDTPLVRYCQLEGALHYKLKYEQPTSVINLNVILYRFQFSGSKLYVRKIMFILYHSWFVYNL